MKRVVITGVGLSSPIGIDFTEFSENLFMGKHSFREATPQDRNLGASKYMARINDEKLKHMAEYLEIPFDKIIHDYNSTNREKGIKKVEFSLLWSCLKAFEDSKLNKLNFDTFDGGIFLGVDAQTDDFFHYYNFINNEKNIDPEMSFEEFTALVKGKMHSYYPSSGLFHLIDKLLDKLPFTGDTELLMTGCSSSNDCIGTAFRRIRSGQLKFALCGAVDIPIDPVYYAMFNSMGILSKPLSENECLVPYSSEHYGFTLAEGAGIVMLEEYENAVNRGAYIYGEVMGYSSNMANTHMTNCDPEGELYSICIKNALNDANLEIKDIDYINSHGIATILDISETKAIKRVFRERAHDIPVSSTKSIIGHSLVASGVLECIAVLACFRNNKIHPTLSLKVQKAGCDLQYTPQQAVKKTIRNVPSHPRHSSEPQRNPS